jgi:hypothetical protein
MYVVIRESQPVDTTGILDEQDAKATAVADEGTTDGAIPVSLTDVKVVDAPVSAVDVRPTPASVHVSKPLRWRLPKTVPISSLLVDEARAKTPLVDHFQTSMEGLPSLRAYAATHEFMVRVGRNPMLLHLALTSVCRNNTTS